MRLKLISCEVFYREMCTAVARSPHMVDLAFQPIGFHSIGSAPMVARLQALVDGVDASRYEAILLGYALCNNGVAGLQARSIPLVIPRAHDCITLFLGSHARYVDYFNNHPGVYFETTGWFERGIETGELSQITIQRQMGMDSTYEELVTKYGEDNAKYLYSELCDTRKNYTQYTFIEMGVGPDEDFEDRVRKDAEERGWKFETVKGDMSMIQRLVDGIWDDKEFLVVPPGSRIVAKYDDDILATEIIQP
jgi:hypothetical protein